MKEKQLEAAGMKRMSVVDSHTGGMPTRVILDGFPALQGEEVADRRRDLAQRFAPLCNMTVSEPRGSEGMVGALLVPPNTPEAVTGVIFFDRAEILGMCGHGTIGLVHTLRSMGQIGVGDYQLDTPVGAVAVRSLPDGQVEVANVPSYRLTKGVSVSVEGLGEVTGDIAYGGNQFFLVSDPPIDLDQPVDRLLGIAKAIMAGCRRAGFSDIDHIELYGTPIRSGADSRNFVLCPDGTYDRSPCGTGTSAKVACLAADNLLAPGQPWVQESITGSTFTLTYQWNDRENLVIDPLITGAAELTAQGDLLFAPQVLEPQAF